MPPRVVPEQRAMALYEHHRMPADLTAALNREGFPKVTVAAVTQWMRRRGLARHPLPRYEDMIPWTLKPEHRHLYPAKMLRRLGRERSGADLTEAQTEELARWVRKLRTGDLVVHYDPETVEGFHYIPREAQDKDLVRVPTRAA